MPLDATDFSLANRLTDRLRSLGIKAVPLAAANDHKAKVIGDFSTSMRGRALVRSGAAVWRTLHMYRDLEILEVPRKHIGPTIDISAAPRPIIGLAHRVSRELRDAEFEMEWFYTDPVLNVVLGGQRACLGIWDGGRIVAIAGQDGDEPAISPIEVPKASFWRRFLSAFQQ